MHLKSDLKSGLTTFAINYSSDKIIIRNKIHPFETVSIMSGPIIKDTIPQCSS